jgi:hypothetical protein
VESQARVLVSFSAATSRQMRSDTTSQHDEIYAELAEMVDRIP